MSEPTNEPTPDPTAGEPTAQGDPAAGEPLGEGGKKALEAERAARTAAEKRNAALQKQLDDINAASLSELERAQKAAQDAQEDAARATAEAVRYRVAAKHGISDEDAELFLTGSDEETVEKQAAALAARTSSGPKPDLSQGASGAPAGGSPEQDFASFLGRQLAG